MSKRHSAKYKLDRRMGENIWGRPKSPVNRREYGPGQHGQRRKSKVSDFGIQLRANGIQSRSPGRSRFFILRTLTKRPHIVERASRTIDSVLNLLRHGVRGAGGVICGFDLSLQREPLRLQLLNLCPNELALLLRTACFSIQIGGLLLLIR